MSRSGSIPFTYSASSDVLPHTPQLEVVYKVSSQPTEIDRHSRIELDTNYVMVAAVGRGWSAGLDGCDIRGPADDRFGKQETCGEFRVVARRPHRDRNASSLAPIRSGKTKPDLERLFYRNAVRAGFAQTVTDPCYIDRETALGHDCAGPDHGVGQYLEAVSTIPMSWVSAR